MKYRKIIPLIMGAVLIGFMTCSDDDGLVDNGNGDSDQVLSGM